MCVYVQSYIAQAMPCLLFFLACDRVELVRLAWPPHVMHKGMCVRTYVQSYIAQGSSHLLVCLCV